MDPLPDERPAESARRRLLRRLILASPLLLFAFVGDVLLSLPPRAAVRALARVNPERTSMMRQREQEARKAGQPVRHVQFFVPLSRVGRPLVQAVVTAEDPNFFFHRGIDWDELKASARADLRLKT